MREIAVLNIFEEPNIEVPKVWGLLEVAITLIVFE